MKWLIELFKAIKPMSQQEIEEQYLNESYSIEDLEWRMRQLDEKRQNFRF